MNVNGIHAAAAKGVHKNITAGTENKQTFSGYQKGSIIEGIISGVSDRISINFSGRELTFPKETVQNAREGEIRKFEIMDISVKGIVLKEVGATNQGAKNNSILFTQIETSQKTISDSQKAQEENEDALSDASDTMTEEDYQGFKEEGISLEKYEAERLPRALERMKEQHKMRDEGVQAQVDQLEIKREFARQTAVSVLKDDPASEKIAERLIDANLPVTEENIMKIAASIDMARESVKMTDSSFTYLLSNKLAFSPENIYKSVHSGTAKVIKTDPAVWEELKESARQIILSEGMKADDTNMEDAKWLLEHGLALNGENLKGKHVLEYMKQGISEDSVLDAAVAAIQNYRQPIKTELSGENSKGILDLIRGLNGITDHAIRKAFYELENSNSNKGSKIADSNNIGQRAADYEPVKMVEDITIQVLNKAQKEIDKNGSVGAAEWMDKPLTVPEITAKRRLEEIRLKLTVEAGHKLAARGIRLETDGLSRVVEGLRDIEKEYYQNLLKETGAEATDTNTSVLKETLSGIQSLKASPSYVLGQTYSARRSVDLQTLVKAGENIKTALAAQAEEAYETLMTAPRSDMGDSITKAFQNVDHLLAEMQMEATPANQRAVRILAYNQMELTEENIDGIKAYDAKVNELFLNLQPAVTATLVKDGYHPLEVPIDELNQKAAAVKEELGITTEERFSSYLVNMEKQKDISPEERKAYIGIYRLLNHVEKTDGAALGAVVKAGREITLGNLLTAVRTMKNHSLDAEVNDDFGAVSDLKWKGESITDQINAGFYNMKSTAAADQMAATVSSDKEDYQKSLLRGILEGIDPSSLQRIAKEKGKELNNLTLEEIHSNINNEDRSKVFNTAVQDSEWLKDFREFAKDCTEEQQFLNEFQIPDTIGNLLAAKTLLNNPSEFFSTVKQVAGMKTTDSEDSAEANKVEAAEKKIFDSVGQPEKLHEAFEDYTSVLEEKVEQVYASKDDITSLNVAALRSVQRILPFTLALSKKEHYEIPIISDGNVTNVSLTVMHKEGEKGKIGIQIPTEQNGTVYANLTVADGKLNCFFTAETSENRQKLQSAEKDLSERFAKLDFIAEQFHYGTGKPASKSFLYKNNNIYRESEQAATREEDSLHQVDSEKSDEIKTSTEDLYKIAESIILFVRQTV